MGISSMQWDEFAVRPAAPCTEGTSGAGRSGTGRSGPDQSIAKEGPSSDGSLLLDLMAAWYGTSLAGSGGRAAPGRGDTRPTSGVASGRAVSPGWTTRMPPCEGEVACSTALPCPDGGAVASREAEMGQGWTASLPGRSSAAEAGTRSPGRGDPPPCGVPSARPSPSGRGSARPGRGVASGRAVTQEGTTRLPPVWHSA